MSGDLTAISRIGWELDVRQRGSTPGAKGWLPIGAAPDAVLRHLSGATRAVRERTGSSNSRIGAEFWKLYEVGAIGEGRVFRRIHRHGNSTSLRGLGAAAKATRETTPVRTEMLTDSELARTAEKNRESRRMTRWSSQSWRTQRSRRRIGRSRDWHRTRMTSAIRALPATEDHPAVRVFVFLHQ
jgi:ribonuclease HI